MSRQKLSGSERLEILEEKVERFERWQKIQGDNLKAVTATIDRLVELAVQMRQELDIQEAYNQEKKEQK